MKWPRKIRAGALQFVLFIGAVIAILLMAFLLLSNTHGHFDKRTEALISVVKSVDFGLIASLQQSIPLENTTTIKNTNDLDIPIEVTKEYWGLFEKRTVTASHQSTKQVKSALVGNAYLDDAPALYVKDRRRPVILAGEAKITGAAFLPEQGLKMGNIYGNSYHGSKLLYGIQKISDSVLPKFNTELKSQITRFTKESFDPLGEVLFRVPGQELKNSFQSPTRVIRDRVVRLQNVRLAGNIMVIATHKIIVEAKAQLEDVILVAPKIIIKDWFKGSFQAFANESIAVGKKCELAYPSALVVNKKSVLMQDESKPTNRPLAPKPIIYMDSYAEVKGVVITLEETSEPQFYPQLKIDRDAKITGEVYCSGNMELKGRINGSVITDSFIALENGSIYQNHLYNGSINSTNLPDFYTGLALNKGEQVKKVMKWLY